MGRADGARRQQDFPCGLDVLDGAAAREFDAGRALAVKENAMDQRIGDQLQVRPLQRRVQIGARGARAPAAASRLLAPADALPATERKVVYILAVLEAELLARLNDSRANRGAVHFRGEQG